MEEMESKRTRQQADRLGELPDSLLVQILSLLDMVNAVKTSVLSKRWRQLWTNVDNIVYRFCHWEADPVEIEQVVSFVDRTLLQCDSPNIKKFSLAGLSFSDECSASPIDQLVEKWLKFVLNKNVEVVELKWTGLKYSGPDCLYQNSSIVSLVIYGICDWDSRYDYSWKVLKSLSLKSGYVDDELMEKLLLGCPMLETLTLNDVSDLRKIDITSSSVIKLILADFMIDDCEEDSVDFLTVRAPWVQELEISGVFFGMGCKLVDMSSVKKAKLVFNYSRLFNVYIDPDNYWRDVVNEVLTPVHHVDELAIGPEVVLQSLSLARLLDAHTPVLKCKHLTVHSLICKHELPGIVCLLTNAEILETLVIEVTSLECGSSSDHRTDGSSYFDKKFRFNGVNYLSSQKGNFQHLKSVKIDCSKKLCSQEKNHNKKQRCFDYELAVYIVRNAPTLEKLVVVSSSNCSACASRYLSLTSSESQVGSKAAEWELKKKLYTFEFHFCNSASTDSE